MVSKDLKDVMNELTNPDLVSYMSSLGKVEVISLLGDRLKERGLTQQDFSKLSGLRMATISQLVNLKKCSINIGHLAILMASLQITDISELFKIQFEDDLVESFTENKAKWLSTGEIPKSLLKKEL